MLSRDIQTERDGETTRFDFPTRDIGPLRFFGLLPMLFAVGFAWMPAGQILRMAHENLTGHGSAFQWVFIAFLSIFVIVAMIPFRLGLFILAGRTRIVVTRDELKTMELAGPVRWTRKVKFAQVERLSIGGRFTTDGQTPEFLRALGGITVIRKDGQKMPVVIGYPREWLEPLVAEISSLMQRRGKTVTIEEAKLDSATELQSIATEQRMERPAESTIELTKTGRSAEFKVPSRGLVKDSYGLVIFGAIWTSIVVAISAAGIFGKGIQGNWLGVIGFLCIFWGVGLAILLLGIHLGTRQWTLRADTSQLQVTRKSVLLTREWRWAAGEIADICIGDSGTKVNSRMLEELQIHPRAGGRKTGLLTDRTHEELAWIATTLRETLRVQAAEVTDTPPRIDPTKQRS